MAEKPENPPAFPREYNDADTSTFAPGGHNGMTLRDWFAGQALAGLVSLNPPHNPPAEEFAQAAYEAADAMLAQRQKED